MQILYWHLTRPLESSNGGGSASPPLLERQQQIQIRNPSSSSASVSPRNPPFSSPVTRNISVMSVNGKCLGIPPDHSTLMEQGLAEPDSSSHDSQSNNSNGSSNYFNNGACSFEDDNHSDYNTMNEDDEDEYEEEEDSSLPSFFLVSENGGYESSGSNNQTNNGGVHGDEDFETSGPLVVNGNGGREPPEEEDKPPDEHRNCRKRKSPPSCGIESDEESSCSSSDDNCEDRRVPFDDPNSVDYDTICASGYDKPILSDGRNPVLIVNLYAPKLGYTYCAYVPGEGVHPPSHLIPYCEKYLLDSIDMGVIPTKLLTKLEERDGIYLIKNGNQVISEIRDYRRFPSTSRSKPVVRQVILTQSTQSVLADVEVVIEKSLADRRGWKKVRRLKEKERMKNNRSESGSGSDSGSETDEEEERLNSKSHDKLTYDERMEIEKSVVNATAGPICLDPSPAVGLITNRLQYSRLKWNTKEFQRRAKTWVEPSLPPAPSQEALHNLEKVTSLQNGRTDFVPFYNFIMKGRSKLIKSLEKEKQENLFKLLPMVRACVFSFLTVLSSHIYIFYKIFSDDFAGTKGLSRGSR